MVYVRKGPFVNVPDPDAPPAGAKHIDAEYLNGVEDYLAVGLPSELDATYATKGDKRFPYRNTDVGTRYLADIGYSNAPVMLYGTTGQRNLAGQNGTVTTFWIIRTNDIVDVRVLGFVPSISGSVNMLGAALPRGFWPGNSAIFNAVNETTKTSSPVQVAYNGANITLLDAVAGDHYSVAFTYSTLNLWPAVLPGTPV